jgi:hypothetical protein
MVSGMVETLLLLLLLGCLWLLLLLLPKVLAVRVPGQVAVVQSSPCQAQPCPVVNQHLGAQPCCGCCCQVFVLLTKILHDCLPAPHSLGARA